MTRKENGTFHHFYRGGPLTGFIMFALWGIAQVGCGGAAKGVSTCDDAYAQLMAKTDEEICSPILYNHFENQVTEWRGRCSAGNMAMQRKEVSAKLKTAQTCSDAARRAEMLKRSCADRLASLTTAVSCLGSECDPTVTELSDISKTCAVPALKGAFDAAIAAAGTMLDERVTNAKRLLELRSLMMMCDDMADVQTPKQAKLHLGELIDRVSVTKGLDDPIAEGSVEASFRNGVMESCEFALVANIGILSDLSDREVDRIRENRRRQKRYIKMFERIGKRLATIDAAVRFPEALAPLREILVHIGADEDSYAFRQPVPRPAERKRPSTSKVIADATRAEDASGALSDADAEACDELEEQLKDYTAKYNAYEEKGNDAKTSAYKAKQEETRRQREALGCPPLAS